MAKTPTTAPAADDKPIDAPPVTDAEAAAAAAEAEAQANADAQAAAQAEAQAKADAEAAAAAAAEAEAPALDLPTLSYLERQITQLNITGHRAGLVDELRDLYGMVIDQDEELGTFTVAMQGITTDPADSLHMALENWGNAARRAIADELG